jgi:DNA-binding Lrp family transcriptional regulator
MRAYILIEASIGKARDVARALSKAPSVTHCYLVTGPYDVIAVVEGQDANAVGSVVTSHIHAVPGVARTVTCLAVL